MNIALRSEDWQLFLAASTIQQCQSGSDFNDSTFAKHSHEPEPSLLVCSTIQRSTPSFISHRPKQANAEMDFDCRLII